MPFNWGGGGLVDIGSQGEIAFPPMRWTRDSRSYINFIHVFIMDSPEWTLLAMS
jgi:hypothetical protein